eukprot:c27410_g1_i2 orf=164-1117(+)
MVSDEELVERLTQVLDAADLTTTTTSAIRKQLESELGVDLTHKKAFIREQVDLFLQSRQQGGEEEEDVADEQLAGQLEEREGEEEDDNAEEEEGTGNSADEDSRRVQAKIHRAMKQSLPKEKKKRATGGGLSKMCSLSPQLQAVIGETELPRTQVVKQLWVYIRDNNLQDPDNRRKIICNDALRAVFGTEVTDMFKMNKLLSKHIWPLDSAVGADDVEPKPKKQKTEKEGGKGRGGGILSPIPLSDALTRFLGTGESELPRAEVVKRIWDYIKGHQLQNPADKRQIICDNKLRELFGCETFLGFGVTKLLTTHFLKG